MLYSIGIAQGPFKQAEFLHKMKVRKIRPQKYLLSYIYPMAAGMQMVFLDPTTILFGDLGAIKGAINVRDNGAQSLQAANNNVGDLINDVQSAPVWSVLDQSGTQNMMRSALGQASALDRLRRDQAPPAGLRLHHELQQRREPSISTSRRATR